MPCKHTVESSKLSVSSAEAGYHAEVVKLVDALRSGRSEHKIAHAGSSPAFGTGRGSWFCASQGSIYWVWQRRQIRGLRISCGCNPELRQPGGA